jgi:hypothetical protein
MGSGIGIIVPLLHESQAATLPAPALTGSPLRLRVLPVAVAGGAMLTLGVE